MGAVRRTGRVQRIAYDATPLSSPTVDLDARLGWLLAMSRLHHRDAAMADGGAFHRAVRDAGHDVSRSLVSRWESGSIPVTYAGLAAYEQVLGLEPDLLTSVAAHLRAAVQDPRPRVARPPLDPTTNAFADRLDELVDRAEEGTADAVAWRELAWHLAASPHVHLRARTWEALAHDLVSRGPRAVRTAYRGYTAAALTLASVPRAQDFLTDAVEQLAASPGVEVASPIGLLARLPTRRAAEVALALMTDPPTETTYWLAVWAVTQKVRAGMFTEAETARLDMLLLEQWRRDPGGASETLAELVASLPEGWRSAFTTAATKAGRPRLSSAVETAEDCPPERSCAVAGRLADSARARVPQGSSYGEDAMFTRLLREALGHRDTGRRHLPALLLAASPFAHALCDEGLALLSEDGHPPLLRARVATLVRYLADEAHRLRVLRHLGDPDEDVAAALAQALGTMTFSPLTDQALRSSLQDEPTLRQRSKLHALGMSGSPALGVIARSARAPVWQRRAAQWWLDHGPAVRS